MKEPTEAEAKEVWQKCGLDFYENDSRFWARSAAGGVVELLVGLPCLFGYAVPKDKVEYIQFSWDDNICLCWIYLKKKPGQLSLRGFFGKGLTEEVSLFWAIKKVFDELDSE